MNARLRRIAADYEEVKKNFSGHKYIHVEPIGPEPAEKYRVTYFINGIYLDGNGNVETLKKHVVIIILHSDYPRYKPLCTIETPIWHPNFKDGQICIGDIWGAGESLSDIIVNIGDMIQYKSWNSFSPLCADAAEWAIKHKDMFPVGNIDLWTGEESSKDLSDDLGIEIINEKEENTQNVDNNGISDETFKEMASGIETNHEEQSDESDLNTDSIGQDEKNSSQHLKEIVDDNEYEDMSKEPEETFKEFDFEITPEELEGVNFIPYADRIQGNSMQHSDERKKINFTTIFKKGILFGLIGGIIAWIIQEFAPIDEYSLLSFYGYTPFGLECDLMSGKMSEAEYYRIIGKAVLMESSIFSAIIGGSIGAVMGIGEGIYYGSKRKSLKYGVIGVVIALFVGFIGGFIAQVLYSLMLNDINEYTSDIYLAFARALGWAVMGLGVGLSTGLIKPDKVRVINCIIGGILGGFIGGFIFNFIPESDYLGAVYSRAVGIVIMGILIGLGIGLLEQFAKSAWLKVVRGDFEGKEYLIFKGITTIGHDGNNTIVLFKDKLVAPNHCDIVQEGNRYVIVDKKTPTGTIVNGMKITRHTLRRGDTIAIGNSVMVFNTK